MKDDAKFLAGLLSDPSFGESDLKDVIGDGATAPHTMHARPS
jgi:hypothetical protein